MRASLLNNNFLVLALFFLVIGLVFANALFNDFAYDDHYLILENPFIRSFDSFKDILTKDVTLATPLQKASGYYRPVSMIFLMGLYQLWGINPFGLHLMNVFLHVLNTFFVFLIGYAIIKDRRIAILGGLIFAIHPIHVEAVAPIFNYMGLLASFFALASFYCFLKSEHLQKMFQSMLSIFFFSLGLLAKEEVIVLPFIFILHDLLFRGRSCSSKNKYFLASYFWFFVSTLGYLFLRSQIIEQRAAFGFWDLSLSLNIPSEPNIFFLVLSVFRTITSYGRILLFPVQLSAFYLFDFVATMNLFEVFLSLFFVLGSLACGFKLSKKFPMVSFWIFFFFISSSLILNIIPIGGLFAERFMYFPSIACCFLLSLLFFNIYDRLLRKNDRGKQFLCSIILMILLIFYSYKTVERNYVWRNDVTLWADTVKKTPNSMIAHLFLADAYHARGIFDKAIYQYEKVLSFPSAPKQRVHNTLGKIYGFYQNYERAISEFHKALEFYPSDVEIYYNLGVTYFFNNQIDLSLRYFDQAQQVDNEYPWIYYGLGMLHESQRDEASARAMYRKTLVLMPAHDKARQGLERLQ